MATITLQPDAAAGQDTYIRNGIYATSNFGVAGLLAGEINSDTTTARTLIKFDLSTLPSAATLSSVILSLYANGDASSNARTFRVYRLKRAWVAGTQNNAANTTGADWNVYSIGNNWQTAGGFGTDDCEQTDIGSRAFTATETQSVFKDFVLAPTTKAALDLGNGWLIKADTEVNDAYGFASSDDATAANRPKLVIVYKVLSPVVGTSSGSGIATGTLTADGKLVGTSTGTTNVVADIIGKAAVEATTAGTASATGDIAGKSSLSGSSLGTATVSGTLVAAGYLSGSIAGVATVVGDVKATVEITGTASGQVTVTGTLVANGLLEATASGNATVAALIKAKGYLEGSSAGISTAIARPSNDVNIAGFVSGTSAVSALLTARGVLNGLSLGTGTVVGVILALGRLSGTSLGTGSVAGNLRDGLAVSQSRETTFKKMSVGNFKGMR